MRLKLIQEKDISTLSDMAERIWKSYYIRIITLSQIEYMLDKFYSHTAIQQQIKDGQEFYFIEAADKSIGFVSISNQAQGKWFLHKFYIEMEEQSKQIGSKAFSLLLENINSREKHEQFEIRLTVNRSNYTSINFYFKNGFKIEKNEDFDIGNGYFMNDFIMVFRQGKH